MGDDGMDVNAGPADAEAPEPGTAPIMGTWFGSPTYQKLGEVEVFGHRHFVYNPSAATLRSGTTGVLMGLGHPDSGRHLYGDLETMLRTVPSTLRRRKAITLQVGDTAPAFTLEGTHGQRVSSAELRGKPIAMRLTRTMGSGII
jgi:hypothetical protein